MMTVKPDEDTTTALRRLARTAEWELVEKWLQSNREAAVTQSLTTESDARARQAQGVILAIDGLIRHTRAAVESPTRR